MKKLLKEDSQNNIIDQMFQSFATNGFASNGVVNNNQIDSPNNSQDDELDEDFDLKARLLTRIVEEYTFDTVVNEKVSNVMDEIKDILSSKHWNIMQYSIKDFGQTKPQGFIINKPKEAYVDIKQSRFGSRFGSSSNGVPEYRVFQSIGAEKYWNNVAYIHCYSGEIMSSIQTLIGEVLGNRLEGLNYKLRTLATGLKTRTIMYILEPNDDKTTLENVNLRNGKKMVNDINNDFLNLAKTMIENRDSLKRKIINDLKKQKKENDDTIDYYENLKTYDDDIILKNMLEKWKSEYESYISKMKRIYFIIVSQGLFDKFGAIKNAYQISKKMGGMNSNSDMINKFWSKI